MIQPERMRGIVLPASLRLSRLTALGSDDLALVQAAARDARFVRARTELMREGQEVGEPRLIVSGWAARARLLPDGRRQLLSFVLPGDLIGLCRHAQPLAASTIIALTDLTLCAAPPTDRSPALAEAYAVSHALDEANLLSQVVRLGRLNAHERIADLLLELHDRLDLAGLVSQGSFELPLTQELLADAVGLTPVHVNRMLQQMRAQNELSWKGGRATLMNPVALARSVSRVPVRISAARPAG